jgi:hypothetical protein
MELAVEREVPSAGTLPAGAAFYLPQRQIRTLLENIMADNGSGGVGVLGVLVGALIVVLVGGGIMFATGMIGSNSSTTTLKVEMPKIDAPAK